MSGNTKGNPARSAGEREALGLSAQNERRAMNIQGYGEIVSFDPVTQTAEIKMMRKGVFNGEAVAPPNLTKTRVNTTRTAEWALTWPIDKGDKVILRFDDKDNNQYMRTGEPSISETDRLNDYSDGVAELGGYPQPGRIPDYQTGKLWLGSVDYATGLGFDKDTRKATLQAEGGLAFEAGGQELLNTLIQLVTYLDNEGVLGQPYSTILEQLGALSDG